MNSLLPDCPASYYPDFLDRGEADALFGEIKAAFDITSRVIRMHDGSEFVAEHASYLFVDSELTSEEALPAVWGGRSPWTASLARVRERIGLLTGAHFRVARCVYYADGDEAVDFHCDLPAYGDTDQIASLSLGAERMFSFRRRADADTRFDITLAPGSLLFMGQGCQDLYEHALLLDPGCREPRLNITFRKYGFD